MIVPPKNKQQKVLPGDTYIVTIGYQPQRAFFILFIWTWLPKAYLHQHKLRVDFR